MNYATLTLSTCCALLYSGLYGLAIVNRSDSPKQVELITYIPNNDPTGGATPTTVIKKNLQPNERIETSLSILEAGIDLHWSNVKRTIAREKASKTMLNQTQLALFRRFSPQDALPAPYARGVPKTIGRDHVFTITGSGYETDVTLIYAPDVNTHKAV